jgi:hypothetical protein
MMRARELLSECGAMRKGVPLEQHAFLQRYGPLAGTRALSRGVGELAFQERYMLAFKFGELVI